MNKYVINPGIDACIVKAQPGAGFFSLFNRVITCMELYPRVKVDIVPSDTPYKSCELNNLWDAIAEPLAPAPYPYEKTEVLTSYPHGAYTGKGVAYTYKHHDAWRFRLHRQFKRIRLHPHILKMSDAMFDRNKLEKSIALIYREEVAVLREQLNGRVPAREAMVEMLNTIDNTAPVLLCVDSDEGTEQLSNLLGGRAYFFNGMDRAKKSGEAPHFTASYGTHHIQTLVAHQLALSRCKHIVHVTSNMATTALFMNPWTNSTYAKT